MPKPNGKLITTDSIRVLAKKRLYLFPFCRKRSHLVGFE
jgi:hypothetical protein